MNKEKLKNKLKSLPDQEKQDLLDSLSKGCVENGNNNFIEVLLFNGEYLFLDHNDSYECDIMSLYQLANEYDWNDDEWKELNSLMS